MAKLEIACSEIFEDEAQADAKMDDASDSEEETSPAETKEWSLTNSDSFNSYELFLSAGKRVIVPVEPNYAAWRLDCLAKERERIQAYLRYLPALNQWPTVLLDMLLDYFAWDLYEFAPPRSSLYIPFTYWPKELRNEISELYHCLEEELEILKPSKKVTREGSHTYMLEALTEQAGESKHSSNPADEKSTSVAKRNFSDPLLEHECLAEEFNHVTQRFEKTKTTEAKKAVDVATKKIEITAVRTLVDAMPAHFFWRSACVDSVLRMYPQLPTGMVSVSGHFFGGEYRVRALLQKVKDLKQKPVAKMLTR